MIICPYCKKKIKNVVTINEVARKAGSVSSERKKIAARENAKKRWERYRKEKESKSKNSS